MAAWYASRTASGPTGREPAVADQEPAQLHGDRRAQGHLPVDEGDVDRAEQGHVGELQVAVQPERGQRWPAPARAGATSAARSRMIAAARGRGLPIEGVPAGQEALADRVAVACVARGRRPGQQGQALGQGTPRRRRRVLARVASPSRACGPGQAVDPGQRLDDPLERRLVDGRVVARALPGDELVGQVGHEDGGHALAVARRHRGTRSTRWPRRSTPSASRPRPASQASRRVAIAGRPGDPVAVERGPLQDEAPAVGMLEAGERGAGPAVGREVALDGELQPGAGQQVRQRAVPPVAHRAQQGAGTSSAPSGPPSR